MNGFFGRILPYLLAFFSSFCIMILELVAGRLVANHVGASLTVWTSVIGIMLGGICLGNVLGGRLADRVDPSRAVGPLYALGAFLTLSCLWVNTWVGMIPGINSPNFPWTARTVVVVILDFLVPATVLGMIGPVVAKMAVERAKRSGSAIGDIYFLGAVGSICGTFLAGYFLMYYAHISTIVTLVAASLALLAALMLHDNIPGLLIGLAAAGCLGAGSTPAVESMVPVVWKLGSIPINAVVLAGHLLATLLALIALARLWAARSAEAPMDAGYELAMGEDSIPRPGLADLALLSFVASLAFMALEMVAGRMVSRHLGSSLYGWTSIIGVLLGGLSFGNFLGGKFADHIRHESQASWLFLVASVLTIGVLFLETPKYVGEKWLGSDKSVLSLAITMTHVPFLPDVPMTWPYRVLFVVTAVFFLPSLAMGTFSPVVAKLAIDRLRRSKRTGQAIGQVYAWGMVGSILGTFLAGFFLIDVLGTKGVLLALATLLAFAATALGSVWHAAWAGIPLGLCVIAFVPLPFLEKQGRNWGIRETAGDDVVYTDESNYYYIKVTNEPEAEGEKRTLVLDNLIHGYFILNHPERLDYDYEHIYAMVAHRVAEAKAKAAGKSNASQAPLKTLFLGGGAYTFQRYMQHKYPETEVDVAEIDRAVTNANFAATGLRRDTTIKTHFGDARQFVERNQKTQKNYDLVFGDAFNDFSVPWHLTTREFNEKLARMMSPEGVYMINIIDAYESDEHAQSKAERTAKKKKVTSEAGKKAILKAELRESHRFGGFLAAWVRTAKLTFPYIYTFGTDEVPGSGLRETFVVVASKTDLKLDDEKYRLGSRDDDPQFFLNDRLFEPKPFGPKDLAEVNTRGRGIILTDDYAPVENLLAPVAETRGDD